jgi:hypothetical protein
VLAGSSASGFVDGAALSSSFSGLRGIAVYEAASGTSVYVADSLNHAIRVYKSGKYAGRLHWGDTINNLNG